MITPPVIPTALRSRISGLPAPDTLQSIDGVDLYGGT